MTGKITFLGPLVLLLAIAFCGCDRSAPVSRDVQPKAEAMKSTDSGQEAHPGQTRAAQANAPQLIQCAIESIAVSPPNPHKNSTITAIAKTVPAELPQEVQLHYVFWLNAAIAQESAEKTLTLAAAKKNNYLYVDAVLMSAGRELARKRSPMVKILNSSPRIENIDFPTIKGPGRYTIKINAMDADSDPLNYALEGDALPEETTIDSSGALKITLTDQSPENIVFWVVVKDNYEGETRQEIKLSFTKKPVQQKND